MHPCYAGKVWGWRSRERCELKEPGLVPRVSDADALSHPSASHTDAQASVQHLYGTLSTNSTVIISTA